jgi:hypothetical protein
VNKKNNIRSELNAEKFPRKIFLRGRKMLSAIWLSVSAPEMVQKDRRKSL